MAHAYGEVLSGYCDCPSIVARYGEFDILYSHTGFSGKKKEFQAFKKERLLLNTSAY
jgi:hypothetical protein